MVVSCMMDRDMDLEKTPSKTNEERLSTYACARPLLIAPVS